MSCAAGKVIATGDSVTCLARVVARADGTPLLQAEISTITYGIKDSDGTVVVATGTSLAVASVIFDTLQTDALWDSHDSTGYNFRNTFAGSNFTPAETYTIAVVFTESGGAVTTATFEIVAQDPFS